MKRAPWPGCDSTLTRPPWAVIKRCTRFNPRPLPGVSEPAFRPHPDLEPANPVELLSLTDAEFRSRFGGTALTRTRRRGLLRNAAIVLGNQGDASVLPALQRALEDSEPLVREAAAWAIARIHQRIGCTVGSSVPG